MNDQAARPFAEQMGVCSALVDLLIDKGIVSRQEFFERFQRAGRGSGPAERVLAPPYRLDGETVLLVEGNPAMAGDLQAALEDAGAEVLVARDAGEALARMAQFDFSAAVLDWRPDTREHRAAARWLREDGVTVLFRAANAPGGATAACGQPMLPKPVPAEDVVRALAQLTGSARVDRTLSAVRDGP